MKKFAIALSYMKGFSCVGPDCEASCCTGWAVAITQRDLERMSPHLDAGSPLGSVEENVHLYGKKDGSSIGRLRLKTNNACCFWDRDGLCKLQKSCGEESLPTICSTYPRNLHRIEGQLEISGQASCPEVARLLLLEEKAVDRVKAPLSMASRMPSDETNASKYKGYLNTIRSIALWLLERPFPIEHRLHFLVELAQRTQPYVFSGMANDLPVQLKASVQPLLTESYLHRTHLQLLELHSDGVMGLHIILQMIQSRQQFSSAVQSHNFSGLVAELDRADNSEKSNLDGILQRHAYRRLILKRCLGDRLDHYSTRIAINHWFGSLFTSSSDIMVYLQRLLMINGVFRVLLINNTSVQDAITQFERDSDLAALQKAVDAVAVRCLYNTLRALDHNASFDKIQEALEYDDGKLTQHLCFV